MPPKQSRPRLDAIIRHIKAGSYDEDMSQLQGAIEDRQRVRQEAVLGMVKETFGKDYVVTKPSENPLPRPRRPRPGGSTDPEVKAAEERARAEEKALEKRLGGGEDEDDPDIESRSPIIGSISDQPSDDPGEE